MGSRSQNIQDFRGGKDPAAVQILRERALQGHGSALQGIPHHGIPSITQLYNYPKEEIKNILNDEEFINKNIRAHLVAVDKGYEGRRLASVGPEEVMKCNLFQLDESENTSDGCIESKIGRDILKEMSAKLNEKMTTVKMKVGRNDIEVRTACVHNIVKRFVRMIFKEYNIDISVGTLKIKDFTDWMLKHKKLYEDYYNGFHN